MIVEPFIVSAGAGAVGSVVSAGRALWKARSTERAEEPQVRGSVRLRVGSESVILNDVPASQLERAVHDAFVQAERIE